MKRSDMDALVRRLELDANDVVSITLDPAGIVATILVRFNGQPVINRSQTGLQTYTRSFPYLPEDHPVRRAEDLAPITFAQPRRSLSDS